MTLKSSTGSGRPEPSETSTRVHDDAGALDVPQELDAQPCAEMRALDQSRQGPATVKDSVCGHSPTETTPRLG